MPIATKNINAEKIQGNLDITSVTSSFTGSYIGNGAGLYNIPAAGIVGLNLSQISSGSVSASIDPVNGLRINTNVTATSFTGSFSGSFTGTGSYALTASVSVSSSYAETSSYSQLSATASYYAETDPVFVSVSGSFATTASFNAFTSSYNTGSFTGSYTGDGSGLYNIPATGIVGLNLSQIASGSATASISPDTGFQINTNTIITGSLTVTSGVTASLFGTASWATNSVTSSFANNAATASYLLGGVTSASFATTASYAVTASYVDIGAITLINPIVQYYDTTSSILAGSTVTLPGGLTFVSSSQFEYIEIFINGLRLRYDRDFFPISTASVQYQLSIPAGSEITYKSLYR